MLIVMRLCGNTTGDNIMNALLLEVKALHETIKEQAEISKSQWGSQDDWEEGYAKGTETAYADCTQKLTELLEFAAKLYPDSEP